ncbi:MAG: hypothetical protein K0R73_488 [Candidatus Midichloriaceae bacterium]|jgi:hypothetical protein|nr:hypothetical protein [Candidatus Midichloriaceae bacterium]
MILNNKLIIALSSFLILFSTTACLTRATKEPINLKLEEYKATYSLPVNAASSPKTHLTITPPKNFVTSPKYFEDFFEGRSSILEYVPQNESFEKWSKILTITLLKGKGMQAGNLTKTISSAIIPYSKDYILMPIKTEQRTGYEVSKLALQYLKFNGEIEMVYMDYYSGPYDCAGLQYTVKLSSWLPLPEALKKAKQLEQEMEGCLKTINF